MTLSEMRRALAEGDVQLSKSLGQHFLHDGNQLRRIVAAAELTSADRVLEIGPGLGPLTELLLAQADEVLAIEKDARLVGFLRKRLGVETESGAPAMREGERMETGRRPVLRLLHADALEFLRQNPRDWSGWKLVANLPYSVASPILVELALVSQPPDRLVATLQLEVARRLVAQAGDSDYGVLTLLVQLRFESRGLFKIPASCFHPSPDVDSACVTLVRRTTPLLVPDQSRNFIRLVKMAFSQRRKMMLKLLKAGWPPAQLEAAFAELRLSPQVRAEAVSLEQFVRLTELLKAPAPGP
ncbi:MAG: ribosomal RNA small subunit methyltransferase A [Verrucomicrobia bacterium]|nr:ribosomal RNA small subunit methyltransferase A [Verrucomicrobiota bacterium]